MFKKLLIAVLSAACVMGLTACGGSSATTEAAAAEPVAAERTEWSSGDIAALSDVVTGITDREYAAGEGAAYKIHEDVTYDRGIVYTVLFNTASVRFGTPGTYDMTYWVYFDAAALKMWADGNGVSLDIPDTGRLAVWVSATVTVTEAEDEDAEDAGDDAAGADADTASGGSGDKSASAGAGSGGSGSKSTASGSSKSGGSGSSSKSASSDSSKSGGSGSSTSASSDSSKSSGSTSCSHNWVDEGHYESVLVQAAYDEKVATGEYVYRCTKCGFETSSGKEIAGHNSVDGGSSTSVPVYETVHHDAVYEMKWVSSYKCSKCGATK